MCVFLCTCACGGNTEPFWHALTIFIFQGGTEMSGCCKGFNNQLEVLPLSRFSLPMKAKSSSFMSQAQQTYVLYVRPHVMLSSLF